jgi:hypothetical protein
MIFIPSIFIYQSPHSSIFSTVPSYEHKKKRKQIKQLAIKNLSKRNNRKNEHMKKKNLITKLLKKPQIKNPLKTH